MNYIHSTIYGIIQGCTEFLPVSSSGHLALLPRIFKMDDPGIVFDLAMHIGTVIAVSLYFHKEVYSLIRQTFCLIRRPYHYKKYTFVSNYMVATLSTIFFALILKGYAERFGRNPFFIACNLIVFGLLMWISDKFFKQKIQQSFFKTFSFYHSFFIGATQVIALFPGVSRSGITLTSARFLNYSRREATRFSFLLSIPLILGGAILKLPAFFQNSFGVQYDILLWGILVSFVTGFLTIHFFINLIGKMGLWGFAFYRVLLGLVIIFSL